MRRILDAIIMYFMVDLMRGSLAKIYLVIMCALNLGICYVIIHQNNTIQAQRVEQRKLLQEYLGCVNKLVQHK